MEPMIVGDFRKGEGTVFDGEGENTKAWGEMFDQKFVWANPQESIISLFGSRHKFITGIPWRLVKTRVGGGGDSLVDAKANFIGESCKTLETGAFLPILFLRSKSIWTLFSVRPLLWDTPAYSKVLACCPLKINHTSIHCPRLNTFTGDCTETDWCECAGWTTKIWDHKTYGGRLNNTLLFWYKKSA